MSLVRVVRSLSKQKAVYWASPTSDGYGGFSFDDPVELPVLWIRRQELFIDAEGREVRSNAVVYVDRDVDLGGYLYLGRLGSLSTAEKSDPQTLSGVWTIRGFEKIPDPRGMGYVRKVWL